MKTKLIVLIFLSTYLIFCDKSLIFQYVYKNNSNFTITILAIRGETNSLDTGKIIIQPLSSVELIEAKQFNSFPLTLKDCQNFNCVIAIYDTLKIIFDNTKVLKCYGYNTPNYNYIYKYSNRICDNISSNLTFTQTDYDSAEFINP